MIKILIVDDSNFSQKITSNTLKKFLDNAEMYFADNGYDGFEKYKEIKPDYTFVDLLMPKLDGKGLIKLIKEYESDAKIIVVSADVQRSVKKEIEEMGVMAFLNKPFSMDDAKFICDKMRTNENA